MPTDLASCSRIWLDNGTDGRQTRLFRRTFEVSAAPKRGEIRIYAESIYHLWINGTYVSRGPIFHHPTQLQFDTHDVASLLTAGKNVIAVLVHTPGMALHNSVPGGDYGLVASLMADGTEITTDAQWRVTDRTGWDNTTPRRSWAIGYIECFDTAVAPANWQSPGFDDSAWPAAQTLVATTIPAARFISRELPYLRHTQVEVGEPTGVFAIVDAPVDMSAKGVNLGQTIMNACWQHPGAIEVARNADSCLEITGLSPSRGAVVYFDLGAEYVGNVVLEATSESAGTVDVGWSEAAEHGKPLLVRKGVSYVDRVKAGSGRFRFDAMNFSGMRYLLLCLRGFTGKVTLHQFGVRATEPQVSWPHEFHSSDERLDAIWRICQRTLRVGTQEGMMDCPTREQAPYVGDGQLTGRWFAQITGDARHWKYLVIEQFRRQSPEGLLRSSVFSGACDALSDYTLHGLIGTRDYYRLTGDRETVVALLENCRRALGYFVSRMDAKGFFCTDYDGPTIRGWENRYDPKMPTFPDGSNAFMFIDHPGLGWHNRQEVGIDRRGTNAAVNALIVLGHHALADLEEAVGNRSAAEKLRDHATKLAARIHNAFFDSQKQVYVDGGVDGKPVKQVSEQTNTWCILAGCCDREMAKSILQRIVMNGDKTIARSGPYFWSYLLPLLPDLGLTEIGLAAAHKLWGRMVDGDASTLWETFLGDDLDSYCHPWSGPQVEFCLTGLLGLPALHAPRDNKPVLRPRYDLLQSATGSMLTQFGPMSLQWQRAARGLQLSGSLPEGLTATIQAPDGSSLGEVAGQWSLTVRR